MITINSKTARLLVVWEGIAERVGMGGGGGALMTVEGHFEMMGLSSINPRNKPPCSECCIARALKPIYYLSCFAYIYIMYIGEAK